jgi:hypothetical protein
VVINSLLEFLWGRGSFCLIFIRSSISKVPSVLDPFNLKRYEAGDFIGAPEPCGFHHSVASLCGPSPQSVDSAVTIQTWTNLTGSALWISPSSCGISLCGLVVPMWNFWGSSSQLLKGIPHKTWIAYAEATISDFTSDCGISLWSTDTLPLLSVESSDYAE